MKLQNFLYAIMNSECPNSESEDNLTVTQELNASSEMIIDNSESSEEQTKSSDCEEISESPVINQQDALQASASECSEENANICTPSPERPTTKEDEISVLRQEFYRRKKLIEDGIKADFDLFLLAWCPTVQVSPDFIVSALGKIYEDVEIRNMWGNFPFPSSKKVFRALIAKFDDETTALCAAKELSFLSRSVMTLPVSRLINFIIEAELRYPMCGVGSTRVFIGGKHCFRIKDHESAETAFAAFGDMRHIRFYSEAEHEENGFICEISYAYASQAYAVMLHFDGMLHKPVERITVKVEETVYEKEILRMVRRQMIDLLDENRVVHI